MKQVAVFLNRRNLRNANRADFLLPAIPSRWGGFYARSEPPYVVNLSAAKLEERGFQLIDLPKEEVKRLEGLKMKREARIEKRTRELKLQERADAVAVCLAAAPLPVVPNTGGNPFVCSVVNLAGTPMIEAYHGCGKGTAYLSADKLIAFHYGYEQPANAPTGDGIEVLRCELSGTQVCL